MLVDYIDKRTANVYGIYGHLGGGKSLTAVELSLYFLEYGWSVTSNIQLINLKKKHNPKNYQFIDELEKIDFWSLPVGAPRGSSDNYRSIIIIDEVAEFFDQYSNISFEAKRFLSWLRHSSKRGQFVFLIVQHPDFINANLRKLIHKWIVCDDMEQLILPIIKMKIPFTSGLVARRLFDKYGNLLSKGFNFASKKDIGKYYDTAQSIAVAGRNTKFQHSKPKQKKDITILLLNFYLVIYLFLIFLW